ncbi:hypothetical protein ABIE50_006398 [Chitinophaga sp. OAE865]
MTCCLLISNGRPSLLQKKIISQKEKQQLHNIPKRATALYYIRFNFLLKNITPLKHAAVLIKNNI